MYGEAPGPYTRGGQHLFMSMSMSKRPMSIDIGVHRARLTDPTDMTRESLEPRDNGVRLSIDCGGKPEDPLSCPSYGDKSARLFFSGHKLSLSLSSLGQQDSRDLAFGEKYNHPPKTLLPHRVFRRAMAEVACGH